MTEQNLTDYGKLESDISDLRADLVALGDHIADLRADLAAVRDQQDRDAIDLKNAIKDLRAHGETRDDSIMVYIAMKERGNEGQVTREQLTALVAMDGENGADILSMHRFVKRYKDAFVEGIQ